MLFIPITIAIMFFKLFNIQFIDSVEKKPNNIINTIFYQIFKIEKYILKYLSLPFGVSILSIFKKL